MGRVDFDIDKDGRIENIFQAAALKFCLLAAVGNFQEARSKAGAAQPQVCPGSLPLLGSADPICNWKSGRWRDAAPWKSPINVSSKWYLCNYTVLLRCWWPGVAQVHCNTELFMTTTGSHCHSFQITEQQFGNVWTPGSVPPLMCSKRERDGWV